MKQLSSDAQDNRLEPTLFVVLGAVLQIYNKSLVHYAWRLFPRGGNEKQASLRHQLTSFKSELL